MLTKEWFTRERLSILSQLFVNLAAGWFGVIFIIPGITRLTSPEDVWWLIKNLGFGIVSLYIAIKLSEIKGK